MRVKEMKEDERACAIANYDYVFPNDKSINGDVAEIWKVKDEKLDALTIFFDTHTFHILLGKIKSVVKLWLTMKN